MVYTILEMLEAGASVTEIIEAYPSLTERYIKAALEFAAQLTERRFDLIPNLVNTVKGFFTQEQAIFGQITDARKAYAGAQGVNAKAQAATGLEGLLGRLLVIVEDNPEIKSDATVQTLMVEIEGTENRVSVERKRFNEAVKTYNIKVKKLSGRILAPLFGFEPKEFFEADEGTDVAPVVDLDLE